MYVFLMRTMLTFKLFIGWSGRQKSPMGGRLYSRAVKQLSRGRPTLHGPTRAPEIPVLSALSHRKKNASVFFLCFLFLFHFPREGWKPWRSGSALGSATVGSVNSVISVFWVYSSQKTVAGTLVLLLIVMRVK